MMETEGWRDFIEDFKNLENSASNIDTMTSEQDLWHAKGQLEILRQLHSLEDATKLAVEQSDS